MSKCNHKARSEFFRCSDKCLEDAHKHFSKEELEKCTSKCIQTLEEESEACKRERQEEEARLREEKAELHHNCHRSCEFIFGEWYFAIDKALCKAECNKKYGLKSEPRDSQKPNEISEKLTDIADNLSANSEQLSLMADNLNLMGL